MRMDFWQLSSDPAEKVCALIAQRVLDSGDRLLIVSSDPDQREAISKALWKAGPESFLANGEADAVGSDRQPVLLSDKAEPVNGATHVIFADGEWRELTGFARTFHLFDAETRDDAAAAWSKLKDRDDLERSFYRQDGGKWVQVA